MALRTTSLTRASAMDLLGFRWRTKNEKKFAKMQEMHKKGKSRTLKQKNEFGG